MDIYVDIDNTVCQTESTDYENAKPCFENIEYINSLYEKGHIITYWTARGTKTNIDWLELTKNQLKEWGAKYHNLKMQKPAYDLFICDKAMTIEILMENKNV